MKYNSRTIGLALLALLLVFMGVSLFAYLQIRQVKLSIKELSQQTEVINELIELKQEVITVYGGMFGTVAKINDFYDNHKNENYTLEELEKFASLYTQLAKYIISCENAALKMEKIVNEGKLEFDKEIKENIVRLVGEIKEDIVMLIEDEDINYFYLQEKERDTMK